MTARSMRLFGVATSQWVVVRLLSQQQNSGIGQSDLARLLQMSKIVVSGLIERLEVTGYIECRSPPAGRRVKCLYATAKGFAVIQHMTDVQKQLGDCVLSGILAALLRARPLGVEGPAVRI